MLTLINRSRLEKGLNPIEMSPALTRVATAHAEDMLANHFVGHRSPTSGEIEDRLKNADIHPQLFAENIGRSDSIGEVHHNLMHSISHRMNVLEPTFTHVGLGIKKSRGNWIITQVFAKFQHRVSQL